MSTLQQESQGRSFLDVADSLADLHVDPFLHEGQRVKSIPEGAKFACSYWLVTGIESIDEDAYLFRREDQDELWVKLCYFGIGIAASSKKMKQFDDIECAQVLLTALFMARLGHLGPERLSSPGLISTAKYDELVDAIEANLERIRQEARAKDSTIVKWSAELGLNPEPTGHAENTFRARCPGTQHGLQIDAEKGLFYCGYCKRGGDVEALKTFVSERRRR